MMLMMLFASLASGLADRAFAQAVQDLSPSVIEQVAQPSPTPMGSIVSQVTVPCNGIPLSNGTVQNLPGLRACAGSGTDTTNNGALADMTAALKARMQLQVDGGSSSSPSTAASPSPVLGLYEGCEHSSVVSGVCSDGSHGVSVPHYVSPQGESYAYMCDPLASIYNKNTPEITTDHHGLSCGQWSEMTAKANKKRKECIVGTNEVHPFHTLEESYIRGAQIQGVACHLAQVTNEMAAGALKLSSINNVPSPCAAIFTQITQLQASAAQQEATLQTALSGQGNVKETELCTNKGASTDPNNPDVGPLRQSACQLKATQQSLEATFVQMAACEVSNRLMHSYQKFLYFAPEDYASFQTETMEQIRNAPHSGSCSSGYAQGSYERGFMAEYTKRVNAVWGNCQ